MFTAGGDNAVKVWSLPLRGEANLTIESLPAYALLAGGSNRRQRRGGAAAETPSVPEDVARALGALLTAPGCRALAVVDGRVMAAYGDVARVYEFGS